MNAFASIHSRNRRLHKLPVLRGGYRADRTKYPTREQEYVCVQRQHFKDRGLISYGSSRIWMITCRLARRM